LTKWRPSSREEHGRRHEVQVDVAWNGSDVTATVSPDSLQVRIGASETAELLKHEQGYSDITFLTGIATGRAILNNSSDGQTTISTIRRADSGCRSATIGRRSTDERRHSSNAGARFSTPRFGTSKPCWTGRLSNSHAYPGISQDSVWSRAARGRQRQRRACRVPLRVQ
jgi:hypothetical protein